MKNHSQLFSGYDLSANAAISCWQVQFLTVACEFPSTPLILTMKNASNFNISYGTPIFLTHAELWIQLAVFYGFLCGIVANLLNILIAIGIMRHKEMRTRFFVIVASLTLCRTGLCCQYLVTAVYRLLRTLGLVSAAQRRLTCHFIHFWLINGYTLELTLLGTLLVERTIAIMFPKYYYRIGRKSVYQICVGQYVLVSFMKLIPSYAGEDAFELVACVNLYSFLSPAFNSFMQTTDFCLTALILVLYCLLILYVRWKSKRIRSKITGNEAAKLLLERHLSLMPVLRTLVLYHCGLTLVAKLLSFLSGIVQEHHSQRLVAAGGIFVCLDLFVNAVTLLATNKEIRDAAMPWLKKKQRVIPFDPKDGVTARRSNP